MNKLRVPLIAVTILIRMKTGHTAASDIESSSVTLITWREDPEKNTVIWDILPDGRRKD